MLLWTASPVQIRIGFLFQRFLLTSPILNPAIITLMLAFFGVKATIVYAVFTFLFAVVMGPVLLGLVARSGNVTWGILLLLCYSIGHSVLVLVAGISVGVVRNITASPRYGRFSAALKIIMGTAILAIALYMFYLSF